MGQGKPPPHTLVPGTTLVQHCPCGGQLFMHALTCTCTLSPCCRMLHRNGIPLLLHMTFKDKGRLSRHHMLSLVSWAKANPHHTLLMYDDADLMAYMR